MSWYQEDQHKSLSEVHKSIPVVRDGSFFRQLKAFLGPGLLIAVGYIDPGNWATDIEGGAKFGYTLISVILISNLFAMVMQYLSLKLGIATGRDLAQACRASYSKPWRYFLWATAELAIAATDLAEVIGAAVALQLLFGLPLAYGIVLTALDVFLILYLQKHGFRYIEALVASLMFLILGSFTYELWIASPNWGQVASSLFPTSDIVLNNEMLYLAVGILGATVMPHNLYLHSSIVQTRNHEDSPAGKRHALRFATIDSTVSLFLAFFINAAILVLAASAFHHTGLTQVADIRQAHQLLSPTLGAEYASFFFAFALLAAGQNSTLTGTIAGQVVMEGFLHFQIKPWVRRLITRLVAIIPALIVGIWKGDEGVGELLVFSQVILSLQLTFAVVPLVLITSDKTKMGEFVNSYWFKRVSWTVATFIAVLNIWLLIQFFTL